MQKSNVYTKDLSLVRAEKIFKAALCLCFFSSSEDYQDLVRFLHPEERYYYNTLKHEKRNRSYLLGRFAAKNAVADLIGGKKIEEIIIKSGIFTHPIVASNMQNVQVSITHCNNFGGAIAFFETHPMGIDIEMIDYSNIDILEKQITEAEKESICFYPITYEIGLTLLWTSKEALSKVLKTGLTTPFEVFEISKIKAHDNYMICYFRNFKQYKAISFVINDYMCSIVCPVKSEINFEINSFQEYFHFIE